MSTARLPATTLATSLVAAAQPTPSAALAEPRKAQDANVVRGKRRLRDEADAMLTETPASVGHKATPSDGLDATELSAWPEKSDETPVLMAQLDTPSPATGTTANTVSTATTAATPAASATGQAPTATRPELGIMTPVNSLFPSSDGSAGWLGATPLGAAATGGLLVALAVGGGGGGGGSTTAAADTTAPTLVSAATSADGSKVILTYSEALSSAAPDKTAFALTADGAAVAVSSAARGTTNAHTLELTLAAPITSLKAVQLNYTAPAAILIGGADASASIKDSAGNRASNLSAQTVTVSDGAAPTLSSAAAYTSADSSRVVLTYSEALLSNHAPAASAFAVTVDNVVNPVSAVEVLGSQVRLTLQNKIASGAGNNITAAYTAPASDSANTNAALQDITGNDAVSISPPRLITTHRFDSAAPAVTSAAINRAGDTVTLTMSEALDVNQTAAAGAYTVQLVEAGSIRSLAVSSVSVLGSAVTLTLSERVSSSAASLQVNYTDPASSAALQDAAGNHVASIQLQPVANAVDSSAPGLNLASFKDSKTLALTFNETLGAAIPGASAFTVVSGGVANPVTAVKVNGSILELSLTNAVTSGQSTTWAYSAPTANNASTNAAVQDVVGNDLASTSAQAVDTTVPTLVSAATGNAGTQIILTLSEAMQAGSYPAGTAFQVLGSQSGARTVSTVSASGSVVTLTLAAALLPTETVSLSYDAPSADIGNANLALQDLAGNDLASLGATLPLAVGNRIAPSLTSQSLALDSTGHFNQVVLGFNDSLAASATPASAFTVVSGGVAQAVSSAAISGSVVTLTLANPLATTASVAVSYTASISPPLADSDGNAVASFGLTSLGQVTAGTSAADTLTGSAGVDYFIGSLGNDTLTGGGGADYYLLPSLANPAGMTDTIKDFGLKRGTGALQGSSEADVLDLSHFLTGYQASNSNAFLQFTKDANGKLALNIDHDGGSSFQTDATLVFDNISVNSSSQLQVNGALVSATATGLSGYVTLSNVQAQWEADNQLRVL